MLASFCGQRLAVLPCCTHVRCSPLLCREPLHNSLLVVVSQWFVAPSRHLQRSCWSRKPQQVVWRLLDQTGTSSACSPRMLTQSLGWQRPCWSSQSCWDRRNVGCLLKAKWLQKDHCCCQLMLTSFHLPNQTLFNQMLNPCNWNHVDFKSENSHAVSDIMLKQKSWKNSMLIRHVESAQSLRQKSCWWDAPCWSVPCLCTHPCVCKVCAGYSYCLWNWLLLLSEARVWIMLDMHAVQHRNVLCKDTGFFQKNNHPRIRGFMELLAPPCPPNSMLGTPGVHGGLQKKTTNVAIAVPHFFVLQHWIGGCRGSKWLHCQILKRCKVRCSWCRIPIRTRQRILRRAETVSIPRSEKFPASRA